MAEVKKFRVSTGEDGGQLELSYIDYRRVDWYCPSGKLFSPVY